LKIQLN